MTKRKVSDGSPSVNLKLNQAAYDFGIKIVDTETRHETTVRDLLIQCIPYTVKQIEHVILGLKDAYLTRLNDLSDADMMDTDIRKIKSQVYARQSEKITVLQCFAIMQTRPAVEQNEYRRVLEEKGGYHALVSMCRTIAGLIQATIDGKEFSPVDLAGAAQRTQGFVKIETVITRVNHTVDVEALVQLRDAVTARITKLKGKTADVVSLGARRKARKQAVDRAAAAHAAVNTPMVATA